MKRDYSISVAMATYNGEKYIKEQLDTILNQLYEKDEIIISDDGSKDNTLEIIKNYEDQRIKLFEGPHKGVKQNFANAIKNCNGRYIFLADQDDIWVKNKIEEVLKTFEKNKCMCVVHDCIIVNGDNTKIIQKSFFEYRKSRAGIISNIWKNKYIGCCMAFDSSMKKYILPIPNDIEMHDQWIGIICEMHGNSIFLNEKLINYRRHEDNVSSLKHYGIFKMVKNRIKLIKELEKRK